MMAERSASEDEVILAYLKAERSSHWFSRIRNLVERCPEQIDLADLANAGDNERRRTILRISGRPFHSA
jgi:hypothetical protein